MQRKIRKRSFIVSLLAGGIILSGIWSCNPGTSSGPGASSEALACLDNGDCPPNCLCDLGGGPGTGGGPASSGTCIGPSGVSFDFCGGDCTSDSDCTTGNTCEGNDFVTTTTSEGVQVMTLLYTCVNSTCSSGAIGDGSEGAACQGNFDCVSKACDNLSSTATCQCIAGTCPTLNIAGDWIQSFVCFDQVQDVCERNDSDTFVINQNCEKVTSNVLDTPTSMLSGTFVRGNRVQWSAMEDGDPGPEDDYSEAGTWTFSDENNFTSSSIFQYNNGSAAGPCKANARKGSPPTPVACPIECCGKLDCCSRPECTGNPNCL